MENQTFGSISLEANEKWQKAVDVTDKDDKDVIGFEIGEIIPSEDNVGLGDIKNAFTVEAGLTKVFFT